MAFQQHRLPPAVSDETGFTRFGELAAVDPATGRTTMFLAVVALGTGCAPPTPPDRPIRLREGAGSAVTLVADRPVPIEGTPGTVAVATLSGSVVRTVEIELLTRGGEWWIQLGGLTGGILVVADTAAQLRQAWIDAPASTTFEAEVGQTVLRTLRIANRGTGVLKIDNPADALGAGFTLVDVDPRTVSPHACADAVVSFRAPAEPGVSTGTLQVSSNDPGPAIEAGHNSRVVLTATTRRPLWAPGDVIVADPGANQGSGVLYRVSPTLGQVVLSAAGLLVFPQGMAFDSDGHLLVADSGFDAPGRVLRIDRFTGTQTVLASGDRLVAPVGVAVAADGTVVVADAGPFAEFGSVVKIDPRTGAQTLVAAGSLLQTPCDLVLSGAEILVLRGDAFGGAGGIVRVDAAGHQSVVAAQGLFTDPSMRPQALAWEPGGTLLVAETHGVSGGVLRINAATGAQQQLDGLGGKAVPQGIATSAAGRILITSVPGPFGSRPRGVLQLDPVNGQPSKVSVDGLFANPGRLLVAP